MNAIDDDDNDDDASFDTTNDVHDRALEGSVGRYRVRLGCDGSDDRCYGDLLMCHNLHDDICAFWDTVAGGARAQCAVAATTSAAITYDRDDPNVATVGARTKRAKIDEGPPSGPSSPSGPIDMHVAAGGVQCTARTPPMRAIQGTAPRQMVPQTLTTTANDIDCPPTTSWLMTLRYPWTRRSINRRA